MIINFFLEKRKILWENRLLVMRDLAKRFKDKQDIKFEAQNNKLVIKKKILTNINIRRDAKKHSGLAMKNPEVQLGKCLILIFFNMIFEMKIKLKKSEFKFLIKTMKYVSLHIIIQFVFIILKNLPL